MESKDDADGYCDDYPSCQFTVSGLRILHKTLKPEEISQAMNIPPSQIHRIGEPVDADSPRCHKHSAWFLASEDAVESRDARRHLDWLLDQLEDRKALLEDFMNRGYRVDLFCRWDSVQGHGGPTLSPKQLKRLGKLGLELRFDFYAPRGLLEKSLT